MDTVNDPSFQPAVRFDDEGAAAPNITELSKGPGSAAPNISEGAALRLNPFKAEVQPLAQDESIPGLKDIG